MRRGFHRRHSKHHLRARHRRSGIRGRHLKHAHVLKHLLKHAKAHRHAHQHGGGTRYRVKSVATRPR